MIDQEQPITRVEDSSDKRREETIEKRSSLNMAKAFLTPHEGIPIRLGDAAHFLKRAELFGARDKIFRLCISQNIDLAIKAVLNIPEDSIELNWTLDFIIHNSRDLIILITKLDYRDEFSNEFINFEALCEELSGNFDVAYGFYEYLLNTDGQQRTKELASEYQGIEDIDNEEGSESLMSLSDKDRYALIKKLHQYLRDNIQSRKKRLLEATNLLEERTKDLKVNAEQTISEVNKEIDRELGIT